MKRLPKRHPAEVTAERLSDAVIKYADKFTGPERDRVSEVINALYEIAEGRR